MVTGPSFQVMPATYTLSCTMTILESSDRPHMTATQLGLAGCCTNKQEHVAPDLHLVSNGTVSAGPETGARLLMRGLCRTPKLFLRCSELLVCWGSRRTGGF